MLKKILLISATTMTASSIAMAAPYIGATVGVTANTADVTANGSNFTGGGYRGVPLNLFLGYGALMNQGVYLAGEFFVTPGTANISNDAQLKTSYNVGAAFIPGLMLTDHTLAYVRAGVLKARFSNQGTSKMGGQFGFGMQTGLTQCIDLRAEYDFVTYQSFNSTSGTASSSIGPRADQFSLGLVYKVD